MADCNHSFAAVMLGRLRMEVDDCIAAYGNLMRVMHGATSDQPPNGTFVEAVADLVSRYGGSRTEAFHSAADHNCKVFVKFLSHNHY